MGAVDPMVFSIITSYKWLRTVLEYYKDGRLKRDLLYVVDPVWRGSVFTLVADVSTTFIQQEVCELWWNAWCRTHAWTWVCVLAVSSGMPERNTDYQSQTKCGSKYWGWGIEHHQDNLTCCPKEAIWAEPFERARVAPHQAFWSENSMRHM